MNGLNVITYYAGGGYYTGLGGGTGEGPSY